MATDFEDVLNGIYRELLRFAVLQLRDEAAAEDAVQDTMVAALAGRKDFAGKAQLKTWVFSILKNKIVDIIRRRSREPAIPAVIEDVSEDAFDALFNDRGRWVEVERPADWGHPEQTFSNHQFWQVFEACLNILPKNTARVFMMREFLGLDTDEICKELGLTPTNCWVVLHRARMSLRLCLQERWFADPNDQARKRYVEL